MKGTMSQAETIKNIVKTLWSRGRSLQEIEGILRIRIDIPPTKSLSDFEGKIQTGNFQVVERKP